MSASAKPQVTRNMSFLVVTVVTVVTPLIHKALSVTTRVTTHHHRGNRSRVCYHCYHEKIAVVTPRGNTQTLMGTGFVVGGWSRYHRYHKKWGILSSWRYQTPRWWEARA